MKRFIFKSILCIGFASFALFLYFSHSNSTRTITDLALENLEALSQNEDGTRVGTCYMNGDTSGDFRFILECDSRTNEEYIYPCPRDGRYSTYTKKMLCTK